MSSPTSVNNSQTVEDRSETPFTTPPAPMSNSATPAPENDREQTVDAEMEDSEHVEEDVLENEEETEDQLLTLPISKIKKIFKMDSEYVGASRAAVYTAGLATELFIQYYTEQASLLAKMDKRKKIQYKDFSTAVSLHDSLNFLSDAVPKTHKVRQLIDEDKINVPSKAEERVEEEEEVQEEVKLPKGQQQLNFQPVAKKSVIQDLVQN